MSATKSGSQPILSQIENNTTLWVGHLLTDPIDRSAGQIFKCPAEGILNNIQVYSTAVHEPGEVELTLHEFDIPSKSWGPAIGDATKFFQRGDDARWVRFGLQPVSLKKDAIYGFRLQSSAALVGFGEAATGNKKPFEFGYEWNGDTNNQQGQFFTYFSLTYKVELCA